MLVLVLQHRPLKIPHPGTKWKGANAKKCGQGVTTPGGGDAVGKTGQKIGRYRRLRKEFGETPRTLLNTREK